MILFYSDPILDQHATLESDEFKHCVRVLRHKPGDRIEITDGRGCFASAVISRIGKNTADLEVIESQQFEKKSDLILLAVAPPKNRNRWEWLLEKSVELGVDRIIPFTSRHSERRKINVDRSQKIMRSAALQSGRRFHPDISATLSLSEIFKSHTPDDYNLFIGHHRADNRHITDVNLDKSQSLILIGPEGDFAGEELDLAMNHGFEQVNLSENRLRTETAGIAAVMAMAMKR